MLWLGLFFYWVVAGLASWQLSRGHDGFDFALSLLFGGFLVPARALSKLLG